MRTTLRTNEDARRGNARRVGGERLFGRRQGPFLAAGGHDARAPAEGEPTRLPAQTRLGEWGGEATPRPTPAKATQPGRRSAHLRLFIGLGTQTRKQQRCHSSARAATIGAATLDREAYRHGRSRVAWAIVPGTRLALSCSLPEAAIPKRHVLGTSSRRCSAPATANTNNQVRNIRRTERSSATKTPKKASSGKVLRRGACCSSWSWPRASGIEQL